MDMINMDAELIIAAIAISVLGLPHGALDPWVAWRAKLFETSLGLLSFLVSYIALCLVGLGAWSIAPTCSLIAFLSYSALHFGRDHEHRRSHPDRLGNEQERVRRDVLAIPSVAEER